ncbi:MAG: S-layer homology domain-containing protein [Thermacetogeniaceae bacterium]
MYLAIPSYVVNDTMPSVAAARYTVKDGDRIIWYYSKDMNEPPPKWDDLVKQAALGTVSPAAAAQQLADLLSGLQKGKLTPAEAITSISDLLGQLKSTDITGELKEKLKGVVSTLSPLIANMPEKAITKSETGDGLLLKIDPEAISDHLKAVRDASSLADKLVQLGVDDAAALKPERLNLEVPPDAAAQKGFAVELPAEALQEITSSGLGLAVISSEVSLSLPSVLLKEAFESKQNLSGVELTAAHIDAAKLNPFRGAGVIGNKAFDFAIKTITSDGKREPLRGGFAEKVKVTLSLEGIDLRGIDKNRLAVYRQKQDGSWEFVGGSLGEGAKSYSFETDRLSVYALMEYQNPFKDTENHWARDAIEQMAMRLIVRGIGDDAFGPDQPLTRAQFAALLVRGLGLEQQPAPQPTFRDVAPDHWGYAPIEAAAKAGLVKGTGNGNFEPNRPVKREEMATVLAVILKQYGLSTGLTEAQASALLERYTDSSQISAWARDGMAVCIDKGIISGRPDVTLAPRDQATRAEAAVVLLKLLKLLGRL